METPTTSFGLVQKVQQGDFEAFAGLFEKYRRRLGVMIYYKLSLEMRRLVEVDDMLQETLLRAFRDIDRFTYHSPGSFLRWLSAIADHVIQDAARFQHRERRRGELVRFRSENNPHGPEPANSRTPSRMLAEEQAIQALLERLDSLPDDYRQAIMLAKIEGLSTQEVAERLGKSREAAALLLHRAIKRFRTLVGEH